MDVVRAGHEHRQAGTVERPIADHGRRVGLGEDHEVRTGQPAALRPAFAADLQVAGQDGPDQLPVGRLTRDETGDPHGRRSAGRGERRFDRPAGVDLGHRRSVLAFGVEVRADGLAIGGVGRGRGDRGLAAVTPDQGSFDGRRAVGVRRLTPVIPIRAWLTVPPPRPTTAATPTIE